MKVIFLKLGGSLITDKDTPFTARLDVIRSIGDQIKKALEADDGIQLLIGHGSGSFGHEAARIADFKEGDKAVYDPRAFQTIWLAAQKLNRIIIEEFDRVGLTVFSFPPSAVIRSSGKEIENWDITPIRLALGQKIIPIIYGDAVLDSKLGGVIYSTEELFLYLAEWLTPDRILLAGKEKGVWADFPKNTNLMTKLNEKSLSNFQSTILASESVDVTGGMVEKVQLMLKIKKLLPETQINIFSGAEPDAIIRSLGGQSLGTAIK